MIQAEGWDKDPDWVERGKDGRFGGGGVAKSIKDATADEKKTIFDETVKAVVGVTKNTIKLSLTDPEFRERAGLSAGMGMAKMIKAASRAIGENPGLEQKIDSLIQKTADKLAEAYGDDKDPFAQAIRKSDGIVAPADSSVVEKMEFAAAKYQIYMEALTQPEKYGSTPKQQQELVGYSIAASIQVAANLACNISFSIALGLLFRESLSRAVSSALLGEVFNQVAIVGLEKADIDDPWIGFGVFLAAGVLSDGILGLAAKKIPGLASKVAIAEGLKREAAELAKREATELAKKEAAELAVSTRPSVTNLSTTHNIVSEDERFRKSFTAIRFNVNNQAVQMIINVVKSLDTSLSVEDISKRVEFSVNTSSKREKMPPEEANAIMYQLRKVFKKEVKDSAEGTIFRCIADTTDGDGELRTAFYKLMGFGERGNSLLAGIVKNGKLVPYLE